MMLTVLAKHYGQGPLSLTDIANQLSITPGLSQGEPGKISVAYMEQIIPPLRTHGFIESQRGAKGG